MIRAARSSARRSAMVAPLLLRIPQIRRVILSDVAVRADHASAKQAISLARDLVAFTAIDLFDSDEQIAPFTTLPCAVTLAWSARDKVFPPNLNGLVARQRLPGATYLELANCGHLPMLDNWRVCASVIRESIARSTG